MPKEKKLGLAFLLGAKKKGSVAKKDEDSEDDNEGRKAALADIWKAIQGENKKDFVEAMLDLLEL